MNLKEFLYKTVKTTINGMISEGKPIPMDTPNDFVYPDFKKYAYKNRKMFKKELQKSNGDSSKMFLTLSALWYKWARKNHPNFTHIKDSKKFGRALMVMMVKDDLIFSIDAFKKTNNIAKLKEDSELDQAFLKAKPVEEETKRDYKKEYAKYGKSKKAKKYRAELNKYNRDKGTYGNGDGKDASHKGGKIVGFEDESKNRGRREKSRLKKEATFVPNSGTMSGGVLQLDNRKYQLKKDIKNVKIGSYIVTLPKGTILYNIAGGLFADHKSLEQYADRNRQYFKKPTFKGIQITQKTDTIKDIDKNSKVLENVAPNHNGKSAPFGSGYDELKEACWDNYKQVGMKTKGGKQVPNCVPESIVKEGVMSDINLLINKSKSEEEFIKTFFKKYGKQVKKSKESIEWVTDLYMDTKNESLNEEQLDEKLITFSNRAPYGQVVFMAGGAGSGKGFAIKNFIDSAGFKVRDVDEMKKSLAGLEKIKKFSVDKWYKKYGKNLSDKAEKGGLSPKAHVEEYVLGSNKTIQDIAGDLKNPNNVASLHYIVDTMGLKDKWVINMLNGKNNKETLPNLMFDITAKKVASITSVVKPLMDAGYDSKNVHLIWVLKDYKASVRANKTRDRVVPQDILLQTHEGASETMWHVITKILPKGLNGRIDVILNNNSQTAFFVDKKGDKITVEPNQQNKFDKAQPVVKGFTSLPVKKQGGGILPEKVWQTILVRWILGNAPESIDLDNPEQFKTQQVKVGESVNEASDTYFKTAGEAVDFAKTKAEKKGFEIDEDDWNSQITMGGRYNRLRPGVGKTHSFQIGLLKKGKPQRKGLAISLYGMDSGKYELTYYIN